MDRVSDLHVAYNGQGLPAEDGTEGLAGLHVLAAESVREFISRDIIPRDIIPRDIIPALTAPQ